MLSSLLQFPSEGPASPRSRQPQFWFWLSLAFAIVYGILALQQGFRAEYVVQDDARQHVFWMQRFVDDRLFQTDLIADYFQSVAPSGYFWLYRVAAWVGLNPFFLSKILPPILGLISTIACFKTVLQLFPVPIAGFISSLLLNQVLWMNDDLVSATPRAFIYPLFLGFCYFLLHRSILGVVGMMLLQGWFYPQTVLISAGLLPLSLLRWQTNRIGFSNQVKDYWLCGAGLMATLAVIVPYALELSQYGPVVTLAEAQQMPEFQQGGRSDFFSDDPAKFWLEGLRSGILPHIDRLPELLMTAILLPVLGRFPNRFPLVRSLQPSLWLLPQILAVSLFWFLAAHALLFKLHLPSRYTQHTFRIVLCWAAGMAIVIGIDAISRWGQNVRSSKASFPKLQPLQKRWLAIGIMATLAAALIFYPSYKPEFPRTQYVEGRQPDLYQFLAQQPPDTMIASVSEEASNIPSFAQRSVLVAKEYAIPYHMGYYQQLKQRTIEVIEAQYSPSLAQLKRLIRQYGIDFWLLDRQAFTVDYLKQAWFDQYPAAVKAAKRNVKQGKPAALVGAIESCTVFQNTDLIGLDAACITEQSAP